MSFNVLHEGMDRVFVEGLVLKPKEFNFYRCNEFTISFKRVWVKFFELLEIEIARKRQNDGISIFPEAFIKIDFFSGINLMIKFIFTFPLL